MPATIRGKVFNDLNNNTILDGTEPGIEGVIVVLYDGTSCIKTKTDVDGIYTFENINVAKEYVLYETVDDPKDVCPPTFCGQPKGYTVSNTKRKSKITVTQNNINNNTILTGGNFGHALQEFVPCKSYGLQIADGNLYFINMVTGTSTFKGTPGPGNALAYEPNSQKLFYIRDSELLRINGDLSTTRLATFQSSIVATIDEKGLMYMPGGGGMVWMNVNQESPEFLERGSITVSGGIPSYADWTYNPVTKKIHTGLVTVDIMTGSKTNVTYTPPIPGGIGAAFSDRDGFDYWLQNSSGSITRSILTSETTGTSILFSQTATASANDGAACIFANLNPDFGDCPDDGTLPLKKGNYRTLFSKDGPRHAIDTDLVFGSDITAEKDGLQNPTATGDLDDGINTPLLKLKQSALNYTIDIKATNKTGKSANIYAWLDWNNDGIFQGNEGIKPIIVTSDTQNNPRNFTLEFIKPSGVLLEKGGTFLRARLTTDSLVNKNSLDMEDTRSYGASNDGEVEDYFIEIGGTPRAIIEKKVDKTLVEIGEEFIYTFVVKNIGDEGIRNINITDTLPENILLIESPSGGQSGGTPGNTILTISIINLDVNSSYTVNFKVKAITDSPLDVAINSGILKFNSIDTGDLNNYGVESNIVETKILPLKPLIIKKYVDKAYADFKDIITYTIEIKNNNLITSKNNIFKDTIPYWTTFIDNSFTEDGIGVLGNPMIGVPIGDIKGGGVKTVSFKVRVNSKN